jgi:hypothetical protein
MKEVLAIAAVALAFTPTGVSAQQRVGHAALGAVSGAVVLGPVGAVAGGVIGYTAGPAIAHSWGVRRSESRRRGQSARQPTGPATNGVPGINAPLQAPKEIAARPAQPPVESAVRPSAMAPIAPLE